MKRRAFILILSLIGRVAFTQDYQWTSTAGSSNIWVATGWAVTVDESGNVITSGHYLETTDFDPGPGTFNLISAGLEDGFIQKLDNQGNLIWVVSIGGSDQDFAYNLTHDSNGNIYVVGGFNQTIDLDPGPGTFNLTAVGDLDAFILKLDQDGNFVWGKSFGSPQLDFGLSIELDNENNIYITGSIYGAVDVDPGLGEFILTPNGLSDAYILKLDNNGNFLWASNFGAADRDHGKSIVVDSLNNVILTGNFDSTVDFDPGPGTQNLTAVGNQDVFLLKLTPDGDYTWVRQIGASGFTDNGVSCISKDRFDNIYIGGRFNGVLTEEGLSSTDPMDYFIVKCNSSGETQWARQLDTDVTSFIGLSIGIDTLGYLYASGAFGQLIDLDPGPGIFETSQDGASIFILKLDTAGNFNWGGSIESTIRLNTRDIHSDPLGNLHITGSFGGDADFDPGFQDDAKTSLGAGDVFTMKLNGCELTFSSSQETDCDSYTTPNMQFTWDTSGLYRYVVPNSQGCDSLITVDLTINYSQDSSVDIISCDEYTVPSGGSTYTSSGTYFDTIPTSQGCDSLITIDLSILSSSSSNISETSCEFYESPAGNTYTSSGMYQDVLINGVGCDSLITIDLTILEPVENEIITNGDTLIASAENVTYQWIDCNGDGLISGETNQMFVPDESGSYKVEIVSNSCPSETPCTEFIYRERPCIEEIYPNPVNGPLEIHLGDSFSNSELTLYDVRGREIYSESFREVSNITLDLSPASGMYLILMSCDDDRELRRVIFD